jgi:hypothetical protein
MNLPERFYSKAPPYVQHCDWTGYQPLTFLNAFHELMVFIHKMKQGDNLISW